MKRIMTLVALMLTAAGCGGPSIQPVTKNTVIVAFGDSLTEGYGAEEKESYPAVLASLLGCNVINEGFSGEVSGDGVTRLPEILRRCKPDLVILCHGGNDFLRGASDAEVEKNLQTMIDAIQKSGADVVLLGVPRPGLLLRAPPLYRQLADRNGVPCDVQILPRVLSSLSLKSDAIHPNAEGYRRIAQRVAKLIRRAQR